MFLFSIHLDFVGRIVCFAATLLLLVLSATAAVLVAQLVYFSKFLLNYGVELQIKYTFPYATHNSGWCWRGSLSLSFFAYGALGVQKWQYHRHITNKCVHTTCIYINWHIARRGTAQNAQICTRAHTHTQRALSVFYYKIATTVNKTSEFRNDHVTCLSHERLEQMTQCHLFLLFVLLFLSFFPSIFLISLSVAPQRRLPFTKHQNQFSIRNNQNNENC